MQASRRSAAKKGSLRVDPAGPPPVRLPRTDRESVRDDLRPPWLDTAADLWRASQGYASQRLAGVAFKQMRKLG